MNKYKEWTYDELAFIKRALELRAEGKKVPEIAKLLDVPELLVIGALAVGRRMEKQTGE